MGVNTKVTAQSARATANTGERLINSILRNIKDSSEYGMAALMFDVGEISDTTTANIVNALEALDFNVTVLKEFGEINLNDFDAHSGEVIPTVRVTFRVTW